MRRRFSAQEILDLRFDVTLQATSSSVVEVELYTPTGQLYETLKTRPAADDSMETGRRHRVEGTRVVTANLPVAGSYIKSRSLYGEWRAEVHLDGSDERCASTKFHLEP